MGTLLKYIFYIILIIVIYLVGRGIYEGQINETTTVGEVVSDVGQGTKEIVKKGVDATVNAAEDATDAAKAKADDYKAAPKRDIDKQKIPLENGIFCLSMSQSCIRIKALHAQITIGILRRSTTFCTKASGFRSGRLKSVRTTASVRFAVTDRTAIIKL